MLNGREAVAAELDESAADPEETLEVSNIFRRIPDKNVPPLAAWVAGAEDA